MEALAQNDVAIRAVEKAGIPVNIGEGYVLKGMSEAQKKSEVIEQPSPGMRV
jgi:hypothetical protein